MRMRHGLFFYARTWYDKRKREGSWECAGECRLKQKGGNMIRYRYRPGHPWRHGFRRERRRKRILITAKLLLLAELVYFACGYVKAHTFHENTMRQETGAGFLFGEESRRQELFGIGIGVGDGTVFWFHRRVGTARADSAGQEDAAGDS